MVGLLLKDIYNLQGQLKIYILLPFLAAFLAVQQQSLDMIVFTLSFVSMLLIISACAYDEMAGFDAYALTLPLTRKDLVLNKYMLSFLSSISLVAVMLLTAGIVTFAFPAAFPLINWQEFILEVVVLALVMNMLLCIFLPLIFKFGTEKARIFLMVIFLTIGGACYFIASLNLSWITSDVFVFLNDWGLYMLAAAAIVMEAVSIIISNILFAKKEI